VDGSCFRDTLGSAGLKWDTLAREGCQAQSVAGTTSASTSAHLACQYPHALCDCCTPVAARSCAHSPPTWSGALRLRAPRRLASLHWPVTGATLASEGARSLREEAPRDDGQCPFAEAGAQLAGACACAGRCPSAPSPVRLRSGRGCELTAEAAQVPLSAEEGGLSSGVGEGAAASGPHGLPAEAAAGGHSSGSDSEAGAAHPRGFNGQDRGVRWALQRAASGAHAQAQRSESAPASELGTPRAAEAQERDEDGEEEGAGDSDGPEKADRKERPRKPHLQVGPAEPCALRRCLRPLVSSRAPRPLGCARRAASAGGSRPSATRSGWRTSASCWARCSAAWASAASAAA